MAPITSDLVPIAHNSVKAETQEQTALQRTHNNNGNVELKEMKSISPLTTMKITDKMIKQEEVEPPLQHNSNKIPLKLINAHITCNICKGYLIDATTLVECLHSFCHSCIMKHLRIQDYCPKCDVLVNKAKLNIKPDTTLQAIVYKLVPELYEKELLRRRAFYKMCPKEAALATPEQRGEDTENLIFSPKEALSLSLEFANIEELPKKSELRKPIYLQCPAIFQVSHLKKFVLSKFGIDGNFLSIELMYKVKTIALPDHYTLMDIAYVYTWKRDAPMRFFFRVIKNVQPVVKAIHNETTLSSTHTKPITVKQESDIKTVKKDLNSEKNNNNVSNMIKINNESEKHESIKLKIELSKQGNMVSILKTGSQLQNSDKFEKKDSENIDKNKQLKDKSSMPKLMMARPKDLKKSSEIKENSNDIKLKETIQKITKGKISKEKRKLEILSEKLAKKKSEFLQKNLTKLNKVKIVPDIDPKKSEFLNTFQLAPRKFILPTSPPSSSVSPQKPLRPIAPKTPITCLKPLSSLLGAMPKRKNKDPVKNGVVSNSTSNKKAKPDDLKQVLEKIIREKSNQSATNEKKEMISFNLAPFPIGSSRIENTSTSTCSLPSSSVNITNTATLSKSPSFDSQTHANSTVTAKGTLPVSNISSKQNLQQVVSNNSISNNNNKQIVPKRSLSPNSTKNPQEPVFKKPMLIAKKQTPEKPKLSESQKQANKNNVNKMDDSPKYPSIAPRNIPFTPPHRPSSYLNFALLNSSKNDQITMARPPIYSPFSPVYAPNSPQYTPNFSIQSRPTYKYTNPQAYANLMDNLYKPNELFPSNKKNNMPKNTSNSQVSPKNSIIDPSRKSPNTNESKKSPKMTNNSVSPSNISSSNNQIKNVSSTTKTIDNNSMKPNANSLLNKLNFPSSLSVTLTTDTDESRTNSPNNKTHSSVNNYIEIVKLPESPTNHNNTLQQSNDKPSIASGNKTPPGCISPPKTIIKIDDAKMMMGENVHKDIINKVNEMCSAKTTSTGHNKSPKTRDNDINLNKENGSSSTIGNPNAAKTIGSKETFQTKFLESILPKLNEKINKEETEKNKTSPSAKSTTKTNGVVNSSANSNPVYSKAVQNKLDELRKISPKPPQNKSQVIPNKTSPCPPLFDQRLVQPYSSPTTSNSYPAYDPTKLANLFNDFAQASQNPMQNIFPGMAPNSMTPFTNVPMVNLMQQAFIMEQWQKIQKLQKTTEQNYLENCLQNLKQNNNQTSSNRLE